MQPGTFVLVDHALSRLDRGLAGFLKVAPNPAAPAQPQMAMPNMMPNMVKAMGDMPGI